MDNDSPNLLVLSLLSVMVTVAWFEKVVPAVAELLNKKCTCPCPLPGADTTTVLPSLRATTR
jgi:hypothetical protein